MTKPLTLDDLASALWRSESGGTGEFDFLNEISKDIYRLHARAILTTIKEAGYAIVPVRPTEEMLRAVDDEDEDKFVARGRAVSAWQAMQSASPQIEGE